MYTEQKYKCNHFKDLMSHSSYKEISNQKNVLGPNLWISHDSVGVQPLGNQAQPIRICFSPQKGFITDTAPLLDIPHLSGGWIILAKEKCSLTDVIKFVHNIFEK
jgi:hypothetical protein